MFEQWVPLSLRQDGGHSDRHLTRLVKAMQAAAGLDTNAVTSSAGLGNKRPFGEVLLRVELVLPDPAAKEKLMVRSFVRYVQPPWRSPNIKEWKALLPTTTIGKYFSCLYIIYNDL